MLFHAHGQMSDSLYKPREKYYCHYSYQEQAICAYRWTWGGVGVEKCQEFRGRVL